ncbi:MAG: thiamine biosynthesis lipoprotein [Limisphaerales bacterium]|jgi:thiamine biosynthesis lipoprotein
MVKPTPFQERKSVLAQKMDHFLGTFFAMGCPCEVLVETSSRELAEEVLKRVRNEAWRIEVHWSRYLEGSIVQKINRQPEKQHSLDAETLAIVEYADQLWRLSSGKFDITSGVYRRIWTFEEGSQIPTPQQITQIKQLVGWNKVVVTPSGELSMSTGMEIDLGGIGKEYAVDACCNEVRRFADLSCLINFGGDCAVTSPPLHRPAWVLGVESVSKLGVSVKNISLTRGGVATSGNVHRFVMDKGRRLGHIIDATKGMPIYGGPMSITVASNSCMEAGSLATLAYLQGKGASEFLQGEAEYWIQ